MPPVTTDELEAIWLAAASLAFESAKRAKDAGRAPTLDDLAFPVASIQRRAKLLSGLDVPATRVHQDAPFLLPVGGKRRLATPAEVAQAPRKAPEGAEVAPGILVKTLRAWARKEYPALLDAAMGSSGPSPEIVAPARVSRRGALALSTGEREYVFEATPLRRVTPPRHDVFAARKESPKLGDLLSSMRYSRVARALLAERPELTTEPLATMLLAMKRAGDERYRAFLQPAGDEPYSRFVLEDDATRRAKGLYAYAVEGELVHVARALDSFGQRVDLGHGRVAPEDCYLDGDGEACRLNALATRHWRGLTLHVCVLVHDAEIKAAESALRARYAPAWSREPDEPGPT